MERKLPQLIDTIICDDIRREDTGKFIYIGVYPGNNIIVQKKLPFAFQKLCFIPKFTSGKGKFNFEATIFTPKGTKLITLPTFEFDFKDESALFVAYIAIGGIKIEEEGEYNIKIYDKTENKLLGEHKFNITLSEKA